MNAIQFIQQHGVDKARKVVEGAPARANWYQVKGKYSNDLYSCNHELYGEAIMLSDLKHLVESLDLVTAWGGVESAYSKFRYAQEHKNTYAANMIQQAIADYEATGHRIDTNTGVTVITPSGTSRVKGGLTAFVDMGDDSHIENHISPNCKVGVK